jgi:1-acyl-sn-glycerol-3-phosphate acyltransferase
MTAHSLDDSRRRTSGYNHASFEVRRQTLRWLLRVIGVPLLAKVDLVEGIENVPPAGQAILLINHIAFIDPIVVLHLLPRNIVPLAKVEVYNYPVVGIFPKIWGVIPVKREEVDRHAVQSCLEILRAGEIILVAPEGTRGPALKQGREGVAYLASRSGAPVIPVAIDGTEGFPALRFTHRWRQPGAHIRFGRPFRYHPDLNRSKAQTLRQMTDEAMYVLSSLLPEYRRGVYADLSKATQETFEWL